MGQALSEALGIQADQNPCFCEAYIPVGAAGTRTLKKAQTAAEIWLEGGEQELGDAAGNLSLASQLMKEWDSLSVPHSLLPISLVNPHFSFKMFQGDKPTKEWSP